MFKNDICSYRVAFHALLDLVTWPCRCSLPGKTGWWLEHERAPIQILASTTSSHTIRELRPHSVPDAVGVSEPSFEEPSGNRNFAICRWTAVSELHRLETIAASDCPSPRSRQGVGSRGGQTHTFVSSGRGGRKFPRNDRVARRLHLLPMASLNAHVPQSSLASTFPAGMIQLFGLVVEDTSKTCGNTHVCILILLKRIFRKRATDVCISVSRSNRSG